MRRIGVVCLVLWLSLAASLPSLAQNEVPALDATYCADGLRFNYPSGWYLSHSESTNSDDLFLIHALVSSEKETLLTFRNHGLAVSVSVYQAPQLLELFRNQSIDKGGGYALLSGILEYFGDTLIGSNLVEFIFPDNDHKIFRLRLAGMLDDKTYTLLDSGIMIYFSYTRSAPFENPEPLENIAFEIFNTITYDPDIPCLLTEQ